MTRKKYFKYKFYCNSAYYASLVAALVVGMIIGQRLRTRTKPVHTQEPAAPYTAELVDTTNNVVSTPTPKVPVQTQVPSKDTNILRPRIDSLVALNWALLDSATERYSARLDSQYNLGRFFNKSEIKELNKLLGNYIIRYTDTIAGDTLLNFATTIMPLNANTPLVTFESLVYLVNVPSQDLNKYGIVFDSDHVECFTDARRQKVFEQYIKAYSNTFTKDDSPNFDIPELASIQQQYNKNRQQIIALQNQIVERTNTN